MDIVAVVVYLVGLTGFIFGGFAGYLLWGRAPKRPQQPQDASEPLWITDVCDYIDAALDGQEGQLL